MRYDSDPQVVKKILLETESLQNVLNNAFSLEALPPGFFDDIAPHVSSLLATLDHFITLHSLNPQFSLSRFSAHYIDKKLSALWESIAEVFQKKEFATLEAKVKWHVDRFVHPHPVCFDNEQSLIVLYKKLVQVLKTYYAEHVRDTRIVAVLNEFVGWVEHIDTQGHHDVHAVIIFAEKVARDSALIQHRVEVVRDIGALIGEQLLLQDTQELSEEMSLHAALRLSQLYSPYLLELYESLLEDMEIIAISNQDYHAFERYCCQHDIDMYEEYHDVLQGHFQEYVEIIAVDVFSVLGVLRQTNLLVRAEELHRRFLDFEVPEEVLGENLSQDAHVLEEAVHTLRRVFPDMAQQYAETLKKVRQLKGAIMKPAIGVYGEYLSSPSDFFERLPDNQARWISILDSALACLDQHDDFYQKCCQLRKEIDEFIIDH
ncbi:hypothetical protein CSA56_04560 [candidate division KSB3 bacterium]|uniref:Uncharacterized protein n=1 Tax=candidate division KSB3 bacterium TaxID=2044937 RepID=A0A2G6KI66_9BACT|nr:MAG: hypothetical protein CSA56_04560 [candidate division KSB3 bacterium]